MNRISITHQQSLSKRWNYTHFPELKDFWPQGTFQDLTNRYTSLDPSYKYGLENTENKYLKASDRVLDPLFGSDPEDIVQRYWKAKYSKQTSEMKKLAWAEEQRRQLLKTWDEEDKKAITIENEKSYDLTTERLAKQFWAKIRPIDEMIAYYKPIVKKQNEERKKKL
jgi:hypothetical protein